MFLKSSPSSRSSLHLCRTSLATTVVAICALQVGCANLGARQRIKSDTSTTQPASYTESQIDLKVALAKAAERQGDFKRATANYEDLVEQKVASPEVLHRLALIYDRQGESLKAEKNYLAALEQNPTDAVVLCNYGYSLYLRESWEAAETSLRKAIEADPHYMRSHVNLGMLLARTGQVDRALHEFASGGLAEDAAHHNIALASAQNGDTETAFVALQHARSSSLGMAGNTNEDDLSNFVERLASRP